MRNSSLFLLKCDRLEFTLVTLPIITPTLLVVLVYSLALRSSCLLVVLVPVFDFSGRRIIVLLLAFSERRIIVLVTQPGQSSKLLIYLVDHSLALFDRLGNTTPDLPFGSARDSSQCQAQYLKSVANPTRSNQIADVQDDCFFIFCQTCCSKILKLGSEENIRRIHLEELRCEVVYKDQPVLLLV